MQTQLLLPAAVGLGVSWIACFVIRRVAHARGWLDTPGGRKDHAAPTPWGGGFAVAAGVLAAMLTFDRQSLAGPLPLGAGAMLALGAMDDRWRISWKPRLAVELLVAGAFVLSLGDTFTGIVMAPWLLALASLWIVAQLNALNMLDNMDALAGGVGAIAAAFLAALALGAGPPDLVGSHASSARDALRGDALALAALCGALGGFLWHNRSPARLFMGDAGSYFTGFVLGASSVDAIAGATQTGIDRFAPVCARDAAL